MVYLSSFYLQKGTEMTEVPMEFESLRKDDVFLIDMGVKIYRVWWFYIILWLPESCIPKNILFWEIFNVHSVFIAWCKHKRVFGRTWKFM